MDVDATKQAWRFDLTEILSLDSEAWIQWTWMRQSRRGGLLRPKFEAWIPKPGFLRRACNEAGLEV